MGELFRKAKGKVRASMLVMGLGQLLYRQWGKGLMYLAIQLGYLYYLVTIGARDLFGFFTLGRVATNPWYGIEGDNSVVMLIMGVLAWIVTALYVVVYLSNVKDAYSTQKRVEAGGVPRRFREELAELLDAKFYKTVLFLPVVGVCIFNILPIVFMILVAFTNYGGDIVPPALVDWVGLANFQKILALGGIFPHLLQDSGLEHPVGHSFHGHQLFWGLEPCVAAEQEVRQGEGILAGVPHSCLRHPRVYYPAGL